MIEHKAGVSGLEKLDFALDCLQSNYRLRVASGDVRPTRVKDIPGYPPDPYDSERFFPLGEKLYLVCSMEEGHALMEFAKSGSSRGLLEWAGGLTDPLQHEAGEKAILKILDAGMEGMRRHRQQTGFPGWVWGAAEHPLNFLIRDLRPETP